MPACAELLGKDAGRSGDHGDLMAKPAQLERKLAHMTLRSAENVAAGKHVSNLHARPCLFLVRAGNSDEGRKVSLLGRPYQAESRSKGCATPPARAAVGALAA